ncbi:MAG TPA: glycosyltransferase family 39 protein, partial [Candidatus Limnocylindrales bacterium]|nr:glycosyltransferase family 39 protein [Candidatus Limnocylindrales bacterium]
MTRQHRILSLIVAAYIVLAVIYSVVTPLFEASDELWHYPMVQHIAAMGELPVQDPATPTLWRQEGSQPPLYYLMAAALTAGIDTSDLTEVRRLNPHADIGLVRPDGNVNMIVHRAEAEAFPWQGAALAVHVARLFSVLLGAGTVLVTYALGRRIFPERPEVALGAAALNAFLPMFLFISGSVNNDNLSNLLGNLLTLEIVMLLAARAQPSWVLYVFLGLTTGAGLLAKFNIGFLIPVIAAALLVVSFRLRSLRPLLLGGLIAGGLTVIVAGWWYWRNLQLYGDPTGLNVFLELVGRRAIPANAAQLWAERDSFLQAFWGFFGGVNVPLPAVVVMAFNAVAAIGIFGAAVFIGRTLARCDWPLPRWLPALVTLLWPLISFVSYLRWTAETPASQGRLLFAALSSILIWIVLGLTWWLPHRSRGPLMTVLAGGFAAVALLTPFLVIAPAYQPPVLSSSAEDAEATFLDIDSPALALIEAGVDGRYVQPGDYVNVFTEWRIESPSDRDWSLFVHLVTPDNVIIAQRDVYPGGGLLATSDLSPGASWDNPIAIPVPNTAP